MSTMLVTQATGLARSLSLTMAEQVDPKELVATLRATAFRGNATDEQLIALLIVAQQYRLNPWTKELYAFPDSNKGIVPVVGVDGWSRIINENPNFDGMEFVETDESIECVMFRKDRSHPTKVREYMSECKRNTGPWQSHPRRMLRHKAMIQCARLAFGYVGIYDQDEAERIIEGEAREVGRSGVAAVARIAPVDSPERDALWQELSTAALQGTESLKTRWEGLSKDQRKAVGDIGELKSRAAMVDDERRGGEPEERAA